MSKGDWVKELPAGIMVCDSGGLILEMNSQAEALFAEDGGRDLLGENVLACHPQPALGKLEGMLEKQTANSYFNTENGEKRFFFQSPWYKEGHYAGFVEISFEVPEEIPHFIRE
ncbi:MAG: PAS domain-containing protein [Chloroflexi bacterium]|nr:PAS domain-containing protein [Chloroflexota bacterium]